MSETAETPSCKLLLVGDGGVGKTTLVTRHRTGEFTKAYLATVGVDVRELSFSTNYGNFIFHAWDTAGQEKFGGLKDAYYIGADACIIMFDVTCRVTYKNVPKWYRDVTRVCENIPIVLVGNKVDVKERVVEPRHICFHRQVSMPYFEVSARANHHFDRPFLHLARRVFGKPDLEFVGDHAQQPDVIMNAEQIALISKAAEQAHNIEIDESAMELDL